MWPIRISLRSLIVFQHVVSVKFELRRRIFAGVAMFHVEQVALAVGA
jgi:hypothetical protein